MSTVIPAGLVSTETPSASAGRPAKASAAAHAAGRMKLSRGIGGLPEVVAAVTLAQIGLGLNGARRRRKRAPGSRQERAPRSGCRGRRWHPAYSELQFLRRAARLSKQLGPPGTEGLAVPSGAPGQRAPLLSQRSELATGQHVGELAVRQRIGLLCLLQVK